MDWATVSKLLKEPLDKAHIKPPAPGKYGDGNFCFSSSEFIVIII